MSEFVERREAAAAARQRRAEDLGLAVHMALRNIPAIDDFVAALEGAGGSARYCRALRAELARRRGGRR